jgi:cellulose synthase/poly-beta-1,6-N-acetylglucosamine synthase-like glycosyltransferase
MNVVQDVLVVAAIASFAYFVVLNLMSSLFTIGAWQTITRHLRTRAYDAVAETFGSPLTPGISILLPAFNEEAGVVPSARSLLGLHYPQHEVIVVNDGSSDGTLERLTEAFDLVPARLAPRPGISCAPIRGTYVSARNPQLRVIDKENGGKADSLNAALNVARYPYVCAVDADAILEREALLNVAKPILDDPDLVIATGGIVRIANGCRIENSQVLDVRLPRSRLATLQVIEYFRAFLVGRTSWSRLGSMLIISGAFGLFRRSLVEEAGGWWTETVGEDIELVIRLHRLERDRGEPYRIEFVPDPVCWTEVPEDLRTLSRQRRRWQRGLAEALWRHREVLGRPRYGMLGLVAFPYFLVFELLGPVLALIGLPCVVAALVLGSLSITFVAAFLAVSVLFGTLLSIFALALEEYSFRRHRRHRDAARLLLFAVLENFGYRQLVDAWRLLAFLDLARGTSTWGAQRRRGLGDATQVPTA